ncbi:virulence protein [Burkholderia pseudomallei]|nr:virulence protein [Burkholderia pseudomallei]
MRTPEEPSGLRQGPLSLPSGGGSIRGMGQTLSAIGPDGMAEMSLPLPMSAGRGYAPALGLTYSSGAGNGPFGIGWQMGTMSIRRRTSHGTPRYDSTDSFLGPDGEVLLVASDTEGQPDVRSANALQGVILDTRHTITRYQPRTERNFSKIEHWQPSDDTGAGFWLIRSADGQVHILGKTAQARISAPGNSTHVAQWLLEESMSAGGEHVYYEYYAEDDVGCSAAEKHAHPDTSAQRYLAIVHYGNIHPSDCLFVLSDTAPSSAGWLFVLVFDYGERAASIDAVPKFASSQPWLSRTDPFSRYEFGFEVRTRRLCRQVLAFHRLQTLAGVANGDDVPALVHRMVLQYDENPVVSMLVACRVLGHELDGRPVPMPPLEIDYQRFTPTAIWQPMRELENFDLPQRWQLVDLFGDGLAGVLYKDDHAWCYCAPQRQEGGAPDAITWRKSHMLPQIPVLNGMDTATLIDVNGDGRLEWLVTHPGLQGYHRVLPEGKWTHFTPLTALPVEYFHPRAQLADLMGAGFSDLVLIGPKSVRLYANERDGWTQGQTVIQSDGITLPIPGADACKLVAFSDVLGSGQPHLVEISADGVTCWPNLGLGRLGVPLKLPGFNQPTETFDPGRVFLADLDGSGAVDLIYAHSDHLQIYTNQSGNGFAAPQSLSLPDGARFDDTCLLQAADIQGLGVVSLVLTIPHPTPHHWRCDLSRNKPWLMSDVCNNMGAHTTLYYRSSVQFWLDEKAAANVDTPPVTNLPFPIHTLCRKELLDEITGNRLVTNMRFAHGVWDGNEREFRGFGRVEQFDTDMRACGDVSQRTAPSLTRSWFATGMPTVDERLADEFWHGDAQAFAGFSPRFTIWDTASGHDEPLTPSESARYWLSRAMKGQLLRSEVYGLDETGSEGIPYTVTESRLQLRLIASAETEQPAAWPSVVEIRSYQYERIGSDPQCSQQVQLALDAFGFPLQSVAIAYPRRPKPVDNPYPETLPDALLDNSYDAQQASVTLVRRTTRYHHLTSGETWRLGLPDCERSDVFTYESTRVPADGFSLEKLSGSESLIGAGRPFAFAGQQQVHYTMCQSEEPIAFPTSQALVAFTETAMLDDAALLAYDGVVAPEDLGPLLLECGYLRVPRLLGDGAENAVWAARRGYTDYGGAQQFWRPLRQRASLLTGVTTLTWDPHYCVVAGTRDAAGLTMQAAFDWRFLLPFKVTDSNNNQHHGALDALGRLVSRRFWGTEGGVPEGYSAPEDAPFTAPSSVDEALALTPGIPVAECFVIVPDSWMPNLSESQVSELDGEDASLWRDLRIAGVVSEDNRVCALARRRWKQQGTALDSWLAQAQRVPPHTLTLTTDRYDTDLAQQLRQQVTFSDGFGRVLQSSVRHEAGDAWQLAEDGSLVTGATGVPITAYSDFRWAVTGRVEYDNKGQVMRVYQPYFLNDWRYVRDDHARADAFADRQDYDPMGRLIRVVTAKGYLRRTQYYPWFVVKEDENDTEALEQR